MNERIRELAEQAQQYAEYTTPQGLEWLPAFKEKFAELIVRECSNICDALQDIPATEPRHCAEDIRIHFGVEE